MAEEPLASLAEKPQLPPVNQRT
eukprot:SAG22_NODE_19327_length_276_cov_0.581921_1_plen_22_part_10